MRARAIALLLLLAGTCRAQTPEDDAPLIIEQRAERITWVHGAPLEAGAAAGGLGGLAGPATSGWREHRLVLQAGPREDARLVLQGTLFGKKLFGKKQRPLGRDALDVRAEQLVVFLRARGADAASAQLVGLYAAGAVKLVAEAPEGAGVIEADEVLLDLQRSFASMKNLQLRARPRGGGGPFGAQGVLLRAERLRAHGPDRVVAERVVASPCEHGAPHVAVTADRLEVTTSEPSGVLLGPLLVRRQGLAGSDAQRRAGKLPRWIDLEGVGLRFTPPFGDGDPIDVPALPFGSWRSDWPLPRVRFGRSSRLGTFGILELAHGLPAPDVPGRLGLEALERVEYYSERGAGGELGLSWDHRQGAWEGEGFFRAFGMDDRAERDRVGTPIETEHRFWLRGLLQERLPGGLQVDAELSRLSDPGVLLEYARDVAQTDKEQETYAYARWSHDDLALRAIGRFRLNDFQRQLEQLPEAKLDWIHAPLLVDDALGGLYVDVAARGGSLRMREAYDLESWRTTRGDVKGEVSYKNALGPLVLRAWGGGRGSAWSDRPGSDDSIDRYSLHAGWNLNTTFWRDLRTPWGVVRHEVVPDVGSRHVFATNRDPSELLPFDEVETVRDTDHLFLRLRTRLLTDLEGRRHKLLDASVETRYFPSGDHGLDVARTWAALLYDVRLAPTEWLSLRARGEHDLQDGRLLQFDASATFTYAGLGSASVSWRDLPEQARALGWSIDVSLTDAWTVGFAQQYDFVSDEFLFHRGRIVRRFHCLALEVTISHDPQQDETSASFSVGLAPLLSDEDPFERDRWRELYGR